ncbi:unnamed protein product (macronuclear) [Paramecium tetraurelia]|uniref:Cilium assembly protein DZIP1 N-terminal domain-containing protein n=1 Tax=Paramecium tetraurelia TaxID=5888 RepID=A0BKK7_PARTE|nr:uncharacterized protein GSPATT00029705001 [Paramecium tetraurelia]CAK59074.1 unnamed protein product [Paramecium tetraurelia]|eukprot:XP_001426472.1 hypothetical protein (macronuclear) [Paramecium tetraurelia strain d4-2]
MDSHEFKENYYDANVMKRRRVQDKVMVAPIMEVFMDICKKLDYTSKEYLQMVIPINESREGLQNTDQIIILNYLKQIAIYLIKSKLELEDKLCSLGDIKQFEIELQKMEADIRQHIRVQQQLQILLEQAQQKLDEFESEKLKSEQFITELKKSLDIKDRELMTIKNELYDTKQKGNQKAPFQPTKTEPIQSSMDQLDNLQLFTLVENSPNKNNFNQESAVKQRTTKTQGRQHSFIEQVLFHNERIIKSRFPRENITEIFTAQLYGDQCAEIVNQKTLVQLLIDFQSPLNQRNEPQTFRSISQETSHMPKKC